MLRRRRSIQPLTADRDAILATLRTRSTVVVANKADLAAGAGCATSAIRGVRDDRRRASTSCDSESLDALDVETSARPARDHERAAHRARSSARRRAARAREARASQTADALPEEFVLADLQDARARSRRSPARARQTICSRTSSRGSVSESSAVTAIMTISTSS